MLRANAVAYIIFGDSCRDIHQAEPYLATKINQTKRTCLLVIHKQQLCHLWLIFYGL